MSATKGDLLQGYRTEHAHLDQGMARLTETLDRLASGLDPGLLRALADSDRFLRRVVVPHAEWEELTFYPAVRDVLRAHGDVNAAMLIDHREILARIQAFAALVRRLEAGERDPTLLDRARILGYQIRALIDVHCRKEEEIYCDLIRRYLSEQEAPGALAVGDLQGHD
jgi:hemerythrin-like domain-containing protein